MQNVEITPVPFAGPGYVRKNSQVYGPGEFKDLQNTVITENGSLVKRPPAQGLRHLSTTPVDKFIGHRNHQALATAFDSVTGYSSLLVCGDSQVVSVAAGQAAFATNLQTASSFESPFAPYTRFGFVFEGFFQYTDKEYFIVAHQGSEETFGGSGIWSGETQLHLAYKTTTNDSDEIIFGDTYPLNSLTVSPPLPVFNYPSDPAPADLESKHYLWGPNSSGVGETSIKCPTSLVTRFKVHKDRLVLAIEDTVFLSKATDPTNFAVADDGAFFKFPNKIIKAIETLGDSIYVVFENSVSVITYTQGPNTDSQVRVISEVIGGEDACVYGDTVYIVSATALYALNGLNISKVFSFNLSIPMTATIRPSNELNSITGSLKLVAFNDGLYVVARHALYATSTDSVFHANAIKYHSYDEFILRIDLNNGHQSRFKYSNLYSLVVADLFYVPIEDSFNQAKLVFLSAINIEGVYHHFLFHHGTAQPLIVSVGPLSDETLFNVDSFSTFDGTALDFRVIPVFIHISQFSPDGNELFMKRFRTLMLEADLPSWFDTNNDMIPIPELELFVPAGSALHEVDYNTGEFPAKVILKEPLAYGSADAVDAKAGPVSPKDSRGYRFGCNQRASSLDFIIRTRTSISNGVNAFIPWTNFTIQTFALYSPMEISSLHVVWTPIKRGPTNKFNDKS